MNMLEAQVEIQRRWKANGNIFITSDIHGFHKNLCTGSTSWTDKGGCRDFPDQFAMTNQVIANTNMVVGADDLLIDLGDWSFGNADNIAKVRNAITCKNIIHLYGNHDHHIRAHKEHQALFMACLDYLEFSANGNLFVCQHYPIEEWNDINRGAIHLFGHRHTKGRVPKNGRSMDVGLDSNELQVYGLDELIQFMTQIPYTKQHH
jgi:calcineurin-like phosphoesterase family protein